MARKSTRAPTARKIIDEHVSGELITQAMADLMEKDVAHIGWILKWTAKEKRVYFDCCQNTLTEKTMSRLNAGESYKHRQKAICPFCGTQIGCLRTCHVSADDIDETYHVFYRRSQKEQNTLLILGVWCGREWYRVRNGMDPAEIQTSFQPCHMIYLPLGEKPRRYVREIIRPRSWFNNYGWGCNDDEDFWSERSTVIGGDKQYKGTDCGCGYRVHDDWLQREARGTRWEKLTRWMVGTHRIRHHKDWADELSVLCRHPQMEYMLGNGMEALVKEALNGMGTMQYINWRAKSFKEMLPMDSNELARLRRMKPEQVNGVGVMVMKLARQLRQTVKLETVMVLTSSQNTQMRRERLKSALKQYGQRWGVMRILRYLQSKAGGNVDIWMDYMEELNQLGEGGDEARVFPRDLREAHAVTTGRIKCKASEEEAEAIEKMLPKLNRKFRFEYGGLALQPFESPTEIIQEGAYQHICIGSYVKSYAMGKTVLLKLRRTDAPGIPFHAVEMNQAGELIQCRGYKNCTFEEDEALVRAFWDAYAQARKKEIKVNLTIKSREGKIA